MLYSLRALLLVASVSAFKVATVPSTVPAPAVAPPTKIAVAPEKILAGNLAAQQQKREFFKLAPWEAKKKGVTAVAGINPGGALSPRTRADGGTVAVAHVWVQQEGMPKIQTQPIQSAGAGRTWRLVGAVAAPHESLLADAVARQRNLITRWAYELLTTYATDERVLTLSPNAPPVELAWAKPPNFLAKAFSPSYIGELKTVPADHEPENVECGFYGIPSRAYRNQFGMAEYARVELP